METIPGGIRSSGPEFPDDKGHEIEDAIANRLYYRTESLSAELISSAETPKELFIGLRQLERLLEDGNVPGELSERYTPPRELSIMFERASILKINAKELEEAGFIRDYDEKTGYATPTKRKYASYALVVEEEPIFIKDKKGQNREVGVDLKYNFGTPEKRKEMAEAYDLAVLELEARAIIGAQISLRLNLDARDSLETLVRVLHGGGMPKFRSAHLKALFNLPDVNRLAENPKDHTLGDQIMESLFLNLVMLNSANKSRMESFLRRPGATVLINRMAEKEGMSVDEWKEKYIGKVGEWESDETRIIKDDGDKKAHFRTEPRGLVTKFGNIPAFGGNPGDFGEDKELEFIENAVGGVVGSVEASWIAATLMRIIGAYASEGYVALPNGKSHLPLGEGRYISGDDTGKYRVYMFNYKEGTKGRPSGLSGMLGRVPDMAMNLFDWARVRVKDIPDPKGDPDGALRSIWDALLGTEGGIKRKDLLTGAETNLLTNEEGYHRLGDLNFRSLDKYFHETFSVMQWLMGNSEDPTGILPDLLESDFKPEDFSLPKLKKKVKYFGICLNEVVLTQGSTHLYVEPEKSAEIIQRNLLKNLMASRIRSSSFGENVRGHITSILKPNGGFIEVPTALVIVERIKKVLGAQPKQLTELKDYYYDSNYAISTIGTLGNVDGRLALNDFVNEVGKVTGLPLAG